MVNRLLFGLATALLGLSSCQKEKNPLDLLPPATQTGANTMGCLVDGQAFTLVSADFNFPPLSVSRFRSRSHLLLYFRHQSGDINRGITIYLPALYRSGTYALNQAADLPFTHATPAYGTFSTLRPEPNSRYLTSPAATGQVLITRFDSVAQIVSGTFAFTVQKTHGEGPETVRLSAGRFDLRYPQ